VRSWAGVEGLRVVLAARPTSRRSEAAAQLRELGMEVRELDFEAEQPESHPALVRDAFSQGDVDVAIVAAGVLEDEERSWQEHDLAVRNARINYVAPVSLGVCLAEAMRAQGHGVIVAVSSVAGERVRRSNFVYGSSKAGMDGFFLGLGEALRGTGVQVLVVRPGFVHTKMTEGRAAAPLSVSADVVAEAIVDGVARRKTLVWVPRAMRPVMSGLRHVPRPLFRKLPL
jgi:decaprenylphospho-beta-D-erythro-pentofuranosid-2-ulose 2-reductase